MNEPIRILNLATAMNMGGSETMMMNYYRNMDRTKVQIDFLVNRVARGVYDNEIEELGGKIYRMCPIYPQYFNKYKRMLKKFFDEHKEYKVVHSNMSELGYFALKEAYMHGVKTRICHAHNTPNNIDVKTIFREYFKYKMKPYITHRFICGYDAGDWLFGKEYHNQFIMMKNAIDAKRYRYSETVERQVRCELGIDKKFVLCHIGRFAKQKNHMFLIDIFNEVLKLNNNSILILIGEGDLKDSVLNYAKEKGIMENILYLGKRNDVYRILQVVNCFVFPSLFEGLGITVIEAQAAGTLSVVADTIPREAYITSNVLPLSLKLPPKAWALEIANKASQFIKRDTYREIVNSGYDIVNNAKWLEDFYLHNS